MTTNQENNTEATQATGSPDDSDLEATKAKAREIAESASGKAQDVGGKAKETAKVAGSKVKTDVQAVGETVRATKERLPDTTPTPPPSGFEGGLKAESSAQDLKARLDWGEPALTIIDVRDRDTHNQGHITGAMPMPLDELVERAQSSLDSTRDIYVYGESDQETAQAANKLREAGFVNVAELKGGLEDWKAVAGPTDGNDESYEPEWSQATNTVARVKDAIDKQAK